MATNKKRLSSAGLQDMFQDASEKLRDIETKGSEDEVLFKDAPYHHLVAQWLKSQTFEAVLFATIVCNFGCTIHSTDLGSDNLPTPGWLDAAFLVFLTFYSLEVSTRLVLYGYFFFSDAMNIFDLVITSSDVIFTLVSPLIGSTPSSSAMRIFRVVRIMRVIKAVRHFRELYLMLHGLINTMKAIFWAIVMIFMVLTCCSIVAVEVLHPINVEVAEAGLYHGCERCPRAFETVMQANLTFIQHILAGDSWGMISLPIIDRAPWTFPFFLFVLLVVNLGLMNLVLTVIVDQAQEARQKDYEARVVEKLISFKKAREGLCRMCERLDTNQSGTLSLDELLDGYDNCPEFANMLMAMDATREDLPTVFQILDEDNSGDVTYTEFVDQLQKLKSQDSHTLLVFMKCYLTELKRQNTEMFKYSCADYIAGDRIRKMGFEWHENGQSGTGFYYDECLRQENSEDRKDFKALLENLRSQEGSNFIPYASLKKLGYEWLERGPVGKGAYQRLADRIELDTKTKLEEVINLEHAIEKEILHSKKEELDEVLYSVDTDCNSKPKSSTPQHDDPTSLAPSKLPTSRPDDPITSLRVDMLDRLVMKYDAIDAKLGRIEQVVSTPGHQRIYPCEEPKDRYIVSALDQKKNANLYSADSGQHVHNNPLTRLCCRPASVPAPRLPVPPEHGHVELQALQQGITKAVAAIVQDSLQISHARVLEMVKNPDFLARMEAAYQVDPAVPVRQSSALGHGEFNPLLCSRIGGKQDTHCTPKRV